MKTSVKCLASLVYGIPENIYVALNKVTFLCVHPHCTALHGVLQRLVIGKCVSLNPLVSQGQSRRQRGVWASSPRVPEPLGCSPGSWPLLHCCLPVASAPGWAAISCPPEPSAPPRRPSLSQP